MSSSFPRRIALAVLLLAAIAQARADNLQQPMFIEADAAELDDRQSISLYLGNVDVQQGSMRLLADEVLVQHYPDRQARKIIAVGRPVRYRQQLDDDPEEIQAEALRVEFESDREELTLIDEAVVIQGEDRFASDRIVYNRVTARLIAGASAQGRERVRIRIEPQQSSDQ